MILQPFQCSSSKGFSPNPVKSDSGEEQDGIQLIQFQDDEGGKVALRAGSSSLDSPGPSAQLPLQARMNPLKR